jgi:hypothetical protein
MFKKGRPKPPFCADLRLELLARMRKAGAAVSSTLVVAVLSTRLVSPLQPCN